MTSLEELRSENERLKQELIAIELAKAKKEQEDLKAQLKEKEKAEYEAEFMKKHNIGAQSKAPETTQTATAGGKSEWENYIDGYLNRAKAKGINIKGRSYTDLLEDMKRERAFA